MATSKRIPKLITLITKPEHITLCEERVDEKNCSVYFALLDWGAEAGINVTHASVFIDGSLKFNMLGHKFFWLPQADVRAAAEELDLRHMISERTIVLRTQDADIVPLRARGTAQRVQKPREWILNRSRRTYRPAPKGRPGQFIGTLDELKATYPNFRMHKPAGNRNVSPRRERYEEARRVAKELANSAV